MSLELEKQLIEKAYYEVFMNGSENVHPIRVLGDAYQEELQKDIPDLSYIRFAQGEVYFHHKDYEAAIFKWENVVNELQSWAKKNIADAYYATGLLSNAEDIYLAVETDSTTLKTEVALKLFSLYIDRNKQEAAVNIIKKTIQANPDYPDVTKTAQTFFERRKDWEDAIELAVNEAKRTGDLEWFAVLNSYVEKGITRSTAPNYFSQVLIELYSIDPKQFEQLVSTFWQSYRDGEFYFEWLKEINYILLNLELTREDDWRELSELHKETYFGLIGGSLLVKQLEAFVPDLLTNWLRLADDAGIVTASAAVLSWSELFPASISPAIVRDAEQLIGRTEDNLDEFEECLKLFQSIVDWAIDHDMGGKNRLKWIIGQLMDFSTQHLFVTGFSGSGKSSFINTILGEPLQDGPTSTMVMFKDSDELGITEISDEQVAVLSGFADFQERMDRRRHALESIIEFKYPAPFLAENHLAILDTPGFNGSHYDRADILNYVHVADTMLFVLDANAPLTEKERSIITQMQNLAPDIPIHFLVNKMDTVPSEQDAVQIVEDFRKEMADILPDAKVFAFSKQDNSADLKNFITSIKCSINLKDKRLSKVLFFIRTTITSLLQKRIDVENQLIEAVHWNEEMLAKLTGGINQVKDLESQKITDIMKDYSSIKESVQKEIAERVPNLLKECSELIKEESDFKKVHLELNDEMNKRLQDYLELDVLPRYFTSLQEWILRSREEFEQSQGFLDELADVYNNMFGEERIKPECDFKILDDWRRDTDRMTSRFQLDKVNILLRRTASQLILKGAGKLLGSLTQNKAILYHKYKSFIENEDYTDTAATVSRQFFQQFELFEKSLQRDIMLFFRNPLAVLTHEAEEAGKLIQTNKEILGKMNTNPELFRDPLTLFEVRLRQFEWMTVAGQGMQTVY